jgi:hypothetical protein
LENSFFGTGIRKGFQEGAGLEAMNPLVFSTCPKKPESQGQFFLNVPILLLRRIRSNLYIRVTRALKPLPLKKRRRKRVLDYFFLYLIINFGEGGNHWDRIGLRMTKMVHNMLASVQMLDLTHGLESAPIPVHA